MHLDLNVHVRLPGHSSRLIEVLLRRRRIYLLFLVSCDRWPRMAAMMTSSFSLWDTVCHVDQVIASLSILIFIVVER